VSQVLRIAGQSAFVLQPTHAPVDVLQIGESKSHDVFDVHAAWH
jgi:hypothetical protein